MNTPWSNHHPNDDPHRPHAHRAHTAPAAGLEGSMHPRSLMPGRAPRNSVSGRSDIYFANQTRLTRAGDIHNSPPPVPPVPPLPANIYPAHVANQFQPSFQPAHPAPPPRPPRPVSSHHPSLFFEHPVVPPPLPPPIPPKIPLARSTSTPPTARTEDNVMVSSPPSIPTPLPEEAPPYDQPPGETKSAPPMDEREFAKAIALSQAISEEEKAKRDKMSSQEDEDLARALEASLLDMGRRDVVRPLPSTSAWLSKDVIPEPGPSNSLAPPGTSAVSSSAPSIVSTPRSLPAPLSPETRGDFRVLDDEAYARKLAQEEEKEERTTPSLSRNSSLVPNGSSGRDNKGLDDEAFARELARAEGQGTASSSGNGPNSPDPGSSNKGPKVLDDEAYARQLANEEERGANLDLKRENTSATTATDLPRYSSQIRPRPTDSTESPQDTIPSANTVERSVSASPAQNNVAPHNSSGSPVLPGISPPSYVEMTPPLSDAGQRPPASAPTTPAISTVPPNNASIVGTSNASDSVQVQHNRPSPSVLTPPMRNIHRTTSFNSMLDSPDSEAQASTSSTEPSSQGLVNVNSFVDKELFIGVTVGFSAPMISVQLAPMTGVMPNIISLPYGRGAPLHFQGPSWKHLLKLMAKLSGTRLEPTVSALAISKKDLKLRTVIQFIKPYPQAQDWRTILYFTIDHPPPHAVNHPNVNDLPYSYTLSPIPTLLHQACDTPVSKTYTVPGSEYVPYPTLPITFPNLATYLQAALDESRRYMNDSSSNHRKLARMIQTCYKSDDDSERPPERRGMSGLLRRVIGRSAKPTPTGSNEDTYELVTPFVADEWG